MAQNLPPRLGLDSADTLRKWKKDIIISIG